MKALVLACCGLAIAGCGSSVKSNAEHPQELVDLPKSHVQLVYERLRSGSYQLDAAADSVRAAYEAAVTFRDRAPKRTDLREALVGLCDYLDGAGSAISDAEEAPISLVAVEKELARYEKQLDDTKRAASDAKKDLDQAQDIASSLLEAAAGDAHGPIQDLFDLVKAAWDDVGGALEALNGSSPGDQNATSAG